MFFKDREFNDPVWATKPAKPNLLVEDQMLFYVSFSAVCKWLSLSGLFLCLLHFVYAVSVVCKFAYLVLDFYREITFWTGIENVELGVLYTFIS